MLRPFLLLSVFLLSFLAKSQNWNYGYSVGVCFSFGNKANRIGVHAGGYLNKGRFQLNLTQKTYYNFRSLGLKRRGFECQLGGGVQVGFSKEDTIRNWFVGVYDANLPFRHAAGYSFIQYWDTWGTSQSTGMLNASIYDVGFITENDLFGNLIHQTDRYRTGAFALEYRYKTTRILTQVILWTHDYSHCTVIDNEDTKKWARFGYYQDNAAKSRNHSLGIWSIGFSQWLPYQQTANINLGLNSEKVRNVIQNEFIHDQPFFPDPLVKRKPAHIPMLGKQGQYLHSITDSIRPANFYFNFGLNELPFY